MRLVQNSEGDLMRQDNRIYPVRHLFWIDFISKSPIMKLPFLLLFLAAQYLITCSGDAAPPVATLTPAEQKGQSIFISRCAHCHALEPETILVGPSLTGIATRASKLQNGLTAEEYIEEAILNPRAFVIEGFADNMPTNFSKELTLEELEALVAFLMTLK